MKTRAKTILLICIIVVSTTLGVYADSAYSKKYIKGSDKNISMELNKSVFTKADEVILLGRNASVDSIMVTPLAYAKDAPILTGEWMNINAQTLRYIRQLGAKKITIVGGFQNISKTVELELGNMGYEVQRIQGADRYETSRKILSVMEKEAKLNNDKINEVIFMSSTAGLENSLAISMYAAQHNIPILWGKDDDLNPMIKYINKKGYDKVYAIGNSERFIDEVSRNLKNSEHVKEIDKYDTNIEMISEKYGDNIDKIYTVNMAYGNYAPITKYISLGVVAAKQDIPILITKDNLTYSQDKFLEKSNVKMLIEVGDPVGDYSIIDSINTTAFRHTMVLLAFLAVIIIRALRA